MDETNLSTTDFQDFKYILQHLCTLLNDQLTATMTSLEQQNDIKNSLEYHLKIMVYCIHVAKESLSDVAGSNNTTNRLSADTGRGSISKGVKNTSNQQLLQSIQYLKQTKYNLINNVFFSNYIPSINNLIVTNVPEKELKTIYTLLKCPFSFFETYLTYNSSNDNDTTNESLLPNFRDALHSKIRIWYDLPNLNKFQW